MLLLADQWTEYRLLDGGDGLKLERWGEILVQRPDPQILWPRAAGRPWPACDGCYHRNDRGGGRWEWARRAPESWVLHYGGLAFKIRPTNFKHLGLFPEQAVNWDWLAGCIRSRMAAGGAATGQPVSLLNLFGYTGAATVAAAAAGAAVCHVDAAAGMVEWCRENAALNGLSGRPIRYLVDDCPAFVRREARRGNRYDAVVMDPPSFGRGRRGEVWKLEDQLWALLQAVRPLLSDRPLLFLLNCYTAHVSPLVLETLLSDALAGLPGPVRSGELGLPFQNRGGVLPCGIFARWEAPLQRA